MGATRDTETAGGFLSRWSARKQAAGEAAPGQTAPNAVTVPGEDGKRPLTDADMPPVDTLDAHSDYAAFFSEGVSEQLRAQALRKLFALPGLHVPDGLDDYDEDFTRLAKLGDIVTHEMKRMLEKQVDATDTPPASQTTAESTQDETAQAPAVPDTDGETRDDTPADVKGRV